MKDIWHPADVESIKARLVVMVCLHHTEFTFTYKLKSIARPYQGLHYSSILLPMPGNDTKII